MPESQPPVRALLDEFARRRARQFGVGVAALVAAVFAQRVPPLVVGVALDALLLESQPFALPFVPASLLPSTTTGQAVLVVALVGAAVVAESACKWYGSLVYEDATLATLHDVRVAAFDAAASLPVAYHDDRDGGDTLSVVTDDVDNLGDLFAGGRDALRYGGGLVSAFAFMVALNWQLAALLLVVPAALVATARVYARLLEPRYDALREHVGAVNVRVRDAVRGLPTVKAFAGERAERDRVRQASEAYKQSKWRALRLQVGYNGVSWFFGTAGIWGLFLVGGYWALAGPPAFFTSTFSAGSLLTFLVYAESFLDPTRRLAVGVVDKVESARASARRVGDLLDRADADEPSGGEITVDDGRIEYDGVSFSYGGDDGQTLSDVSFTAEPGDFVGVVGSTGAGKSTVVKLLLRFYDPDAGEIRLDGQRVGDAAPASVREHVGYVSQDPFLFPGTVAENVALGDPDPDREAVEAAARDANAHAFVSDLTQGYDTAVGERGASLSGGQRQRLAIARALYRDPAVLVLDEATSHVDNETEAAIQRSLAETAADRTVLAVAHRLSTVRDADEILVVDDGEVVERGTHDDLVDRGGRYETLWRIQTGAVAAASDERGDRGERGGRHREPEVVE